MKIVLTPTIHDARLKRKVNDSSPQNRSGSSCNASEGHGCKFSGYALDSLKLIGVKKAYQDELKTYFTEINNQLNFGNPLSLKTQIIINRGIYHIEFDPRYKLSLLTRWDFLEAIKNYKKFGKPITGSDAEAMKSIIKAMVKEGYGLRDKPPSQAEIDGVTRGGISWNIDTDGVKSADS